MKILGHIRFTGSDDKERVSTVLTGRVEYCLFKNDKPFGRTFTFHKDNFPKFFTPEVIAEIKAMREGAS